MKKNIALIIASVLIVVGMFVIAFSFQIAQHNLNKQYESGMIFSSSIEEDIAFLNNTVRSSQLIGIVLSLSGIIFLNNATKTNN